MSSNPIPAVSVRQVQKHFRRVHALRGIDLDIQQGEFFGLLGPNGAGKSTLINILAGLTRASSGTAAVLGRDVVTQSRQSRSLLGVVPQELVFDPFFKVREVLEIQAGYFGVRARRNPWIDELLEALDLQDKQDANMRSLSGGMKRRVLIAQALVHQPRVLILDEPTAGVDVELRQSLWRFTQRLHGEGMTIVLTTHYLEEAESLCDRIAIMNHGAIVALERKEVLLAQYPGYRLHVRVARHDIELPQAVRDLLVEQSQNGLCFHIQRDTDQLDQVLSALQQANAGIVELSTSEQTLEGIFLELTGRVAANDPRAGSG